MASEKEMTLGEFLRQEREQRCITIEQVASATKVGVRTLHALEEDHYAELPAKPFIRGFVTSYCRFIGLEPKEILARYESYITQKSSERPNREGGHSGYVFEKKDGEQQSRTILLIAIVSFIVVGGIAMLVLKPSLKHHRSSHLEKLRAAHGGLESPNGEAVPGPISSGVPTPASVPSDSLVQVESPKPSPSPESPLVMKSVISTPTPSPTSISVPSGVVEPASLPSPEVSQSAAGINPLDPLDSGKELKTDETRYKLVFRILSDVWVRYQVDNRPSRKFIVRKGRTLYLRAKEQVVVQISDPKSVSYSYNGGKFDTLNHAKKTIVVQGDATLFYPHELSEKIKKPFGNSSALPKIPDSMEDSLSPVSNATP